MKINRSAANQGSVLVIALVVCVVLLISLTSYLTLISGENRAVGRTQSWNAAMPVAEAGVEEALTQLQYAGSTANLGINGWTIGADGMYHKTRTLNSSSYFAVAIQPATDPVIWSTGYISAPISGGYVGRLVKVVAAPSPSFGHGITAKGTISLSGGATLDSYTVTNGVYDTVPGAAAVALTDTNVAGAISLTGGGYIDGYADTGPGGTVTTSGNAVVGSTNYVDRGGSTNNPNVQTGYYNNNSNFQFNDNSAPSFNGVSYNTSFSTFGTTNIAGFPGQTNCYEVSSINLSGGQSLMIYGNVTIYVTQTGNNALSVSGQSYIDITTNSILTLYLAGNMSVSGGGFINGNGLADALTIYGLPTCTSVSYSGGADFVGVVDAPEADFSFSGNEKAVGAFVVKTANISGSGGVHWDPTLLPSGGFAVNNWNEMSLNQ